MSDISICVMFCYEQGLLLQPTNGDSARGVAKSLVWKFFQDGETKEEFICQLCPKHKVIRTKHGGTSNLLRHVRRFHQRSFINEQSKQVLRGSV